MLELFSCVALTWVDSLRDGVPRSSFASDENECFKENAISVSLYETTRSVARLRPMLCTFLYTSGLSMVLACLSGIVTSEDESFFALDFVLETVVLLRVLLLVSTASGFFSLFSVTLLLLAADFVFIF